MTSNYRRMSIYIGFVVVLIFFCLVLNTNCSIFKEFTAHKRDSPLNDGNKIIYCPAGPPGPPGPTGLPGIPGRDGRDGKTIIELDKHGGLCAQPLPTTCPEVTPPNSQPPPFQPSMTSPTPTVIPLGTQQNPGWSCQEIYNLHPEAISGPYWLKTYHEPYQTHCEMINEEGPNRGGWTLVARVDGNTNDFAGISPTWTNSDLINEDDATDLTMTGSMKNHGWGNIVNNQLMACFSGPHQNCATFTHNKEMTLADLFKTQFAVETSEHYTFKTLMGRFGKSLDISQLKTEWCGLNLGDLCSLAHPPSRYHGTHVCRIGCIGDSSNDSCHPQDYALGIGVAVCQRGSHQKQKDVH